MSLGFVNIRLFVDVCGVDGFAAYSIIASLAPWIALLNLGTPAATQNLIGEWRAKEKASTEIKQAAAKVLGLVSCGALPVALAISYFAKFYLLGKYDNVSFLATLGAVLLMLVAALNQLLTAILFAEHRGLLPNVVPAITALSTFIILWTMRGAGVAEPSAGLLAYFLPNAPVLVLLCAKAGIRPRIARLGELEHLMLRRATGFLGIAVLGTATLSVDYVIMARILSPQDISTYNLLSKLFLVSLTIHAVVLAASWTPVGDLYLQGRFAECRRYVSKMLLTGVGITFAINMVAAVGAEPILQLLSGKQLAGVSLTLVTLWVAYSITRVVSDTYSTVAQAIGDTKAIRRYIAIQAPLSISLQLAFGKHFGGVGILVGIIASFMLTCVWYLPYRFYKRTRT